MASLVVGATVSLAVAVEPVGFVEPQTFAGSGRQLDLALADVDGDGDLDVVSTNRLLPNYVAVFENNGAGLLAAEAPVVGAYDSPASLVLAGDVDGDDDTDLVTGGIAGNRVRLLRNDGTGSFAAEVIESIHSEDEGGVLADLDGDGDLDLAHHSLVGYVLVYANDGAGRFTAGATLLESLDTGPGLATGDLDGAPGLEIVASAVPAREIHVYRAPSGLAYARTQVLAVPGVPTQVVTSDLDGDGDTDAAALVFVGSDDRTGGRIALFVNDGAGALSAGDLIDIGAGGGDLAVADANVDGVPDLVAVNAGGQLVLVLGDGAGGFLPPQAHPSGVASTTMHVVAGDLGGDPRPEIVVGSWVNSTSAPTVLALLRHSELPGPRDVVAEPRVLRAAGSTDVRLLGADLQNLAVVDAGGDLPVAESTWISDAEIDVRLAVPPGIGSRTVVVSVTHPDGKRAYTDLELESVDVAVSKGRIVERERTRRDRVSLRGTVRYNDLASREGFTFANDTLTVWFGDVAAPETLTIPANDTGWDVSAGRRHLWRSPAGVFPRVRLLLDTATGEFRLRVRRAEFAGPVGDEVTLGFEAVSFGASVNSGSVSGPSVRGRGGRLEFGAR